MRLLREVRPILRWLRLLRDRGLAVVRQSFLEFLALHFTVLSLVALDSRYLHPKVRRAGVRREPPRCKFANGCITKGLIAESDFPGIPSPSPKMDNFKPQSPKALNPNAQELAKVTCYIDGLGVFDSVGLSSLRCRGSGACIDVRTRHGFIYKLQSSKEFQD